MGNRQNQMKLLGVCLLLLLAIVAGRTLSYLQSDIPTIQGISAMPEEALPDAVEQPVNINTADQATLEQIPGIGPVLAQRILDYRKTNGPFTTSQQIQEVKGIGVQTYQNIQEYICIE